MKIKKFKCGLCKEPKRFWMTRIGLRKHLEEEHRIMVKKFSKGHEKGRGYVKNNWIIEEECND